MNTEDKKLIDGLAERLQKAAVEPVEPEAVKYITDTVAAQPNAVYRLTQAVLLQELALNQLNEELEKAKNQSSSFLGGVVDKFLGGRPAPSSTLAPKTAGTTAATAPSFLQSAASTAMGIAGGAMLFSGIKSLLGSPAQAATPSTESSDMMDDDDYSDSQDDNFGGDDFGGFGD